MVERYLIKKSLMKPLQAYNELKRIKSLELDASDPSTAAAMKEFKAHFAGFEHLFLLQKQEKNNSTKSTSGGPQSMAQTPKGNAAPVAKPEVIVKEVCCCNLDKKGKLSSSPGPCQRKT